MRPTPATVRISIDGVPYEVDCLVYPARFGSHVGADHPRYPDYGTPMRIEALRVRTDYLALRGS